MIELEFDEKTHTYKYHGKVVPSVTQVIAEWHKVDVYGVPYHVNRYTGAVVASDKMRESAEFGTAVHKVCAAIAQGKAIDSTKLAEIAGDRIASYIDQFNRWANTHKPICEAVECIVISKDRRYAGMIDLVCVIQDKRVIVDIKTGEASLAHIQLAAYAYAYTSQMRLTKYPGRYVLHLSGNDYNFSPCQTPLRSDFNVFLSMLNIYSYIKNKEAYKT